jgi:hypothetical protein
MRKPGFQLGAAGEGWLQVINLEKAVATGF